jgi:hypothetical protein
MEHGGHRDERDRWGERRWRIDEPVARRQASAHDVGHVNGRMSRIERRDPDMNGQRPIKIFRAPRRSRSRTPCTRRRDYGYQMRVEGPRVRHRRRDPDEPAGWRRQHPEPVGDVEEREDSVEPLHPIASVRRHDRATNVCDVTWAIASTDDFAWSRCGHSPSASGRWRSSARLDARRRPIPRVGLAAVAAPLRGSGWEQEVPASKSEMARGSG